jgi:hypothetical protein
MRGLLKAPRQDVEKPMISRAAFLFRRFPQAFNTPAVDNPGKFN